MNNLHIAIDARLSPAAPGGVFQTVLGVAYGLSQLDPQSERYTFLVNEDYNGWLDKHLGQNSDILKLRTPGRWSLAKRKWWSGSRLIRPRLADSDTRLEELGFDGIHLLLPMGFRTEIASVYHVHDLQHLHYPEYFQRRTLQTRHAVFPALCRQASRVITMTQWGKEDVIKRLDISPDKISVVGWGAVVPTSAGSTSRDADAICHDFQLEKPFAYFPAKGYPHKNHLRLIAAIAQLRDEAGMRIPLILTGADGAATSAIASSIKSYRLEHQVRHLGFVPSETVRALFELCRCVVFPSCFEGWGLPISEAISLGKPIVCSASTCLPEVARDAAIYFDASDSRAIADKLRQVWTQSDLRTDLKTRAIQVARSMTWEKTAQALREIYRTEFGRLQSRTAA